ncbi:hypothetical protein JVU11DRAFT_2503 [Chiua virens]|nr:hypothetical protein JVU11DRAFT_2503 [Chiua virens]
MSSISKVWLVTGASSGFGRAVSEHALRQGDNVVATLRKPDALLDLLSKYPSQLLVLCLDVKNPDQIRAIFENALEKFGRVDVVLNNAGFGIINEAEGMSEERGRDLFEVLFWGAVNVSKEAVKVFRERNDPPGGRLLQISSRTALIVPPGFAHYAAGKAALFRTNVPWNTPVEPVHSAYQDPGLPTRKVRSAYLAGSVSRIFDGDPSKFARAMYRLAYMDDPPFYLPLHRVALQAAKTKGEGLIRTAEEYVSCYIAARVIGSRSVHSVFMVLNQSQSIPKVWFVTGASTGFGRLITERALEDGDKVVATLRRPSMLSDLSIKYPASQLLVLQLDVSDPAAISSAFNQAIALFHRIDVVLNNAGFYVVAEVEGISDDNARAMFDTMFWGAGNVMKEAVRCFRDTNHPMGGQLLNVSSRTAIIPQPGGTMYAAAKAGKRYIILFAQQTSVIYDQLWRLLRRDTLRSLTRSGTSDLSSWNPDCSARPQSLTAVIEPPIPAYASNPSLPTMKYRALYPGIETTHFDGDPNKFADAVCRLVKTDNLPSFIRLPMHRVALESVRKKGEMLVDTAEKVARWSDDIYFDQPE